MCNTPTRRVKSGVISRRRRKDSQVGSECGESNRSNTTTTDVYDVEKDYLDEFDFDGDDDGPENNGPYAPCSHSQAVYLRACKRLEVSPNSYFLRNLVNDTLMLQHHLLGPSRVKPIAIALIENSSVTSLDLGDNGLGLLGVRHIVEMFTENTFIVDLNLAENDLRTEGTKHIIEKIKEADVLHKLNLSGNNLQEYDGDLFRDYIEETRNLKELRLNQNCFRELGGMALGECVGWNDSIERLELSWNHLRNHGAKAIAKALAVNNGIKYLDVSWNGFYLDGCKEMAQTLQKNTTLELGDNPLTATGAYYLVNEILEMPNCGLKEIDLGHQSVEPQFLDLLEKVRDVHLDLQVHFGAVLGQDVESKDEEQELMNENPVVVLIEFGNLLGYRLIDLFAMMDKDNSRTLTREEIKLGLLGCNIPLSEKALDSLVQKLDEDGDGEIDYGELIAGKQMHRRKLNKTIMMSREQKMDMEETEVGRVRKKLKRLMDKKAESLNRKPGQKGAETGADSTTKISVIPGLLTGGLPADGVATTGSGTDNVAAGVVSAVPLPTEAGSSGCYRKLILRKEHSLRIYCPKLKMRSWKLNVN